jgi:hypothetical protein
MYSKADSSVYQEYLSLIERVFPELSAYSFGLLFRSKVKKSRGNVILAEICSPNKLMSYYAKNKDGNPYDFIMIVDEMVWACAKPADRTRLIRHELRHVFIDEKGNPKLIGHDFADFYAEVELNKDDPTWAAKLVEVTLAGYNQVKDGQQDPRVARKEAENVTEPKEGPQQVKIEAAIKAGVKRGMKALGQQSLKPGGTNGGQDDLGDEKALKGGIDGLEDKYFDESSVPESFIPHPTVRDTAMSLDELARERGLTS